MAVRVLLISANGCTAPEPVFPLGLTVLNAALRRAGVETKWFDFLADTATLEQVLEEFRPDVAGVSLRNVDDVLILKRETFYQRLTDICEIIRRVHRCPVVLGGSGFSIFPERLLELTGADFGIQGEGETSFLALIDALTTGGGVCEIPGLISRRGGEIAANPPGTPATHGPLETADRPRHVVEYYLRNSGILNLQTQRGCAHTCCYCTYPLLEGRHHRGRDPELVAEEMAQLERQGACYAFIVDSVFNSSARHVEQVCEALLRRNLKIRWGCFMRPQGLTAPLARLMGRAGLSHIEFGSDSFCDPVLKSYGKNLTVDDIFKASEAARQAQLDFCHFLILGGPGETEETLSITFDNSIQLGNPVILAVVGMRVYPETPLHARALREGQINPAADLLAPAYYIAPGLTVDGVFLKLQDFAKGAANWIVGDPDPGYQSFVSRLRRRGVAGPLWSYFALARRLWPEGAPDQAS